MDDMLGAGGIGYLIGSFMSFDLWAYAEACRNGCKPNLLHAIPGGGFVAYFRSWHAGEVA
jgi:hypothetical protein